MPDTDFKSIKMTTEYLTAQFERFNREYFDGALPQPRIALSKSRTRLGSMTYKRRLTRKGYKLSDFAIHISTYYDMTEWQVQNVLLHEMIHYSIAYTGVRDTSAHGVVFCGMMDVLNRKYGWEITVSSRTSDWKPRVEQKPCKRLILALRTSDGKDFLSVVNPKFSTILEKRIRLVRNISWHGWYVSDNSFFANMPAVRSLRGRKVSPEDFNRLLTIMDKAIV